jgi:hypothetical protein
MEKVIFTIGEISARFGIAKHVVDYIYCSGKLPCPQMVSGRKIFYKADVELLENYLSQIKNQKKGGKEQSIVK